MRAPGESSAVRCSHCSIGSILLRAITAPHDAAQQTEPLRRPAAHQGSAGGSAAAAGSTAGSEKMLSAQLESGVAILRRCGRARGDTAGSSENLLELGFGGSAENAIRTLSR